MQKRQKLTMKLVDRYVITESPASSVLELGFCLILACGLLDGYCKPWYVAISLVIFILVIFSVVLSLFIRRQKIVIDSRGIHYYERFLFKITKHDYPWSRVSKCYIDRWHHYYSMPVPMRRLVVVTELSNGSSKYHDIDLKDFELAFRMSHLKRAILEYSNNAGIFDEEQTSANRKSEMLYWLIIVLVLILVFLCVQISDY